MKTSLGPVIMMYDYTKFHGPRYYSYRDMNYCLVNFGPVTDGQMQSDLNTETGTTLNINNKVEELY